MLVTLETSQLPMSPLKCWHPMLHGVLIDMSDMSEHGCAMQTHAAFVAQKRWSMFVTADTSQVLMSP